MYPSFFSGAFAGNASKAKAGMTAGERREEIQARKTASDDDKRALKKLNGHDLAKLHKETVRKMNRREEIRQALHGRSEVRAIEVGKILAKIQVQRDSGGVKLVHVCPY